VTATRGSCRYVYNPSEIYQRNTPGTGVETVCGALTWPANDEPELGVVRLGNGDLEYRPTGRVLPRAQPDPYCPSHGGSAEPPPPPLSMAELEHAYQAYQAMAARYRAQEGVLTAAVPEPAALTAAPPAPEDPVTADQVTAAAEAYQALAASAAAGEEPGDADGETGGR
jgi:hypothetical protein